MVDVAGRHILEAAVEGVYSPTQSTSQAVASSRHQVEMAKDVVAVVVLDA